MSVRLRKWISKKTGKEGQAWVCAYTDKEGTPRIKSFKRKSLADAFQHKVIGELKAGTHVPHRKTVSLREAADIWYHACEVRRLGRSALVGYKRMKEKIVAKLGGMKLNDLTVATVRAFEIDCLQENSVGETEKRLWALKQILAEAQAQGLVGQNVVLNLLVDRKGKKDGRKVTQKHKVKVGVDYPTPEEMRIILATLESANAKSYLKILTLAFCGLRCNELRALRRQDVEVSKPPYRLHVQQGVDRWGEIGPPKTARGERTIDLGPTLVKAWREYLLKTPKTELDLAFPSQHGGPLNHSSTEAVLKQAQVGAGIVNAEGRGKYSPHDLRHYFASWCINRKEDGGLGMGGEPKRVQEWLGHANIKMTYDLYGHLFPRSDSTDALAAADAAFFNIPLPPVPTPATVHVLRPSVQEIPVMPPPPPPIDAIVEAPQPQVKPSPVSQTIKGSDGRFVAGCRRFTVEAERADAAVLKHPGMPLRRLAKLTGVPRSTLWRALERLNKNPVSAEKPVKELPQPQARPSPIVAVDGR